MNDLRTAAQQALEALETLVPTKGPSIYNSARDDLRAALAQQAEPVEPVAWECKAGGLKALTQRQYDAQTANIRRHYTRIAPPQRKPLTDEEIDALPWNGSPRQFARAVERKVRGEEK